MVKAIIFTLAAAALCVGLFIFTELYVGKQFDEFSAAVETLYDKTENKTANREDGFAVRTLWNSKRKTCTCFCRITIFRTWTIGLAKRAG